jgi:hypothetical protein
LGVGGYINNENKFQFVGNDYQPTTKEYYFDGWKQPDGSRFVLRKKKSWIVIVLQAIRRFILMDVVWDFAAFR